MKCPFCSTEFSEENQRLFDLWEKHKDGMGPHDPPVRFECHKCKATFSPVHTQGKSSEPQSQ